MAELAEIRDAIKTTIENNISGLRVYDTIPDVTNLPAVVPFPRKCDFDGAMGMGMDIWEIDLIVLVSPGADRRRAQEKLDGYITGRGSDSVRKVLFDNSDLGLTDGTFIHPTGVSGYGGSWETHVESVGAILHTTVRNC